MTRPGRRIDLKIRLYGRGRARGLSDSDLDGLPVQLAPVADLFDAVIQLQPEGKKIHIRCLKGGPEDPDAYNQLLDPSTMLIQQP